MRVHELKTWRQPFEAMWNGAKLHEVRNNDRDFQVGDRLLLREYVPGANHYTGRVLDAMVTFITAGGDFGVPEHMVVMTVAIRRHCVAPHTDGPIASLGMVEVQAP